MLSCVISPPLQPVKLQNTHAACSLGSHLGSLSLRLTRQQRRPCPGSRQSPSYQARSTVEPQAITRGHDDAEEAFFEVAVRKPLGLVLVEGPGDSVVVEEVVPGGNADQLGNKVRVGDRMVACSATVLKAGKEGEYERRGYGGRPYDSFERIMFPTAGQDFGDVMKAIASNSARWGITEVTLHLQRLA